MSFWGFLRGPASTRLLLEFGAERGVDAPQLLAGSGLELGQLTDPNAVVSAAQELRVVENLLRQLRNPPGLGLEVGLRYRLSTFGMWGYALMSCPTFGAALEMSLRFLPLTYAYSLIVPRQENERVVLDFSEPDFRPGLRRFLVERDMAAAAALQGQIGGEGFALLSFELKAGRGRIHASSPAIDAVAGATPMYDAPGYALSFHRRYLDLKLPQADPTNVVMCEQACVQLMDSRRAHLGTAKIIEHYLGASVPSAIPTLASFARLTNTSARTLKRRLQQEGTSFREVVARSRAHTAAELVRDPARPLTAIAERLGYADLSCFSQAFKRWHGVSPSTYRKACASQGDQ